jgi:Secretion system C-terminal sorting domain
MRISIYITWILLLICGYPIFGQRTYSILYDLDSNSTRNYSTDIVLQKTRMYVSSIQYCGNGTIFQECSVVSEFNASGELIGMLRLDTITSGEASQQLSSFSEGLVFSGHGYSANGENTNLLILSAELELDSIRKYYCSNSESHVSNRGNLVSSDSVVYIYGSISNMDGVSNSVQILRLDENLQVRSERYYSYLDENLDINCLQETEDNNLAFILWHEPENGDNNLKAGFVIIKIDANGDTVAHYAFDDVRDQPSRLMIAKDGSSYFSSKRNPLNYWDTSAGRINKLNKDLKTLEWSLVLPNDPLTNGHIFIIKDYLESANGDILACGRVWDNSDSEFPGGDIHSTWNGFIVRISSTGDIVWLRKYRHLNELLPVDAFGKFRPSTLNKIIELMNGDIIALGDVYVNNIQLEGINENTTEAFHMWLLRTNKNGCLYDTLCSNKQILASNDSCNYNIVVSPDNQWNVGSVDGFGNYRTRRLSFSADSAVINENHYLELIIAEEETGSDWMDTNLYFRSMNGKVYQIIDSVDKVLYDFTLEIGDSFTSDLFDFPSTELEVVNIDSTLLLNNERRKVLTLVCANDPDGALYGKRVWIEGIGDLGGFLNVKSSCTTDQGSKLLCFYNNLNLLYIDSSKGNCWVTSVNVPKLNDIVLFPNPTPGYLFVAHNEDIIEFSVYSATGIRIMRQKLSDNLIDLNSLQKGLYYIWIRTSAHSKIVSVLKI